MTNSRTRLVAKMVRHGATQVELRELFRESEIIWQIRHDDEISDTCIQLEQLILSAARNSQNALDVIDRMHGSSNLQDRDLLTALKKYVEDACEAIKVVDNKLKDNGASLESLLCEIPDETQDDEASWRNLIGRRDVIAHNLLTIDNSRVYVEAVRDFGSLHQLLSKTYFAPVKTDWASGRGFPLLLFRTRAIQGLAPAEAGATPGIGESLIFVCEDEQEGFLSFRFARTQNNGALIAASHAPRSINLSIYAVEDS